MKMMQEGNTDQHLVQLENLSEERDSALSDTNYIQKSGEK
jgi:hypothetical protein